jgi:hypothetical protein
MQIMWNAIETVENSGLCSSLLHKLSIYICGTLRYQARTGDTTINNEYEDYLRIKLGRAYDYTGRFTLRQSCMLDIKSIALKGDVGTNIVRDGRDLYFQGIEADRIGDPYDPRISRNYVRGLTLDNGGRIISAKVFSRDRMSGMYYFDGDFPMRDEFGLPKFLFNLNPISYDDYRGVSVFKTAIDNANYIERMRNYELQAMLWASSQSGVYYTTSGMLPDNLPFDDNGPVAGTSQNFVQSRYNVEPNTVTAMGVGEKVEMFPHERPSPNVIAMYEDTKRDICQGVGVSTGFAYNATGRGSAEVRFDSAQDARAIEIWQQALKEDKLETVATLILANGIAVGDIPFHPNFMKGEWFFPPKPTIDVGRESAANINEYNAMLNTGAAIAAENSQDIEEVQAQCGEETRNSIEIAKTKADDLNKQFPDLKIDWREVYAFMKRGGASGQGGSSSHMLQAAQAGLARETDPNAGATSDGVVTLNLADGSKKHYLINKEEATSYRGHEFRFNPDQRRDAQGRWVDENGNPTNEKDTSERIPVGVQRIDSATRGKDFGAAIRAAAQAHRFGIAVQVKPDEFYTNPDNSLYLTNDGMAGAVVTKDGDLESVFRNPASKADINQLLGEASRNAKTLDAFDIGGHLPELYAKFGFKPVARVKFDPTQAPKGWDVTHLGTPDVVLMVRDQDGVTGLPDITKEKEGYGAVMDEVPVLDYADAADLQQHYKDIVTKGRKETDTALAQALAKIRPSEDNEIDAAAHAEALHHPLPDTLEADASQEQTRGARIAPPTDDSPKQLGKFMAIVENDPDYKRAANQIRQLGGSDPEKAELWSLDQNTVNGQLTPERAKLHEQIVNKFLNPKAVAPVGQKPKALFLIGAPGSGKSTAGMPYVKEKGLIGEYTLINPDDTRSELPEYEGWNSPLLHKEASLITNREILPKAIEQRHNILIDTTGANLEKATQQIDAMAANGYDVSVVQRGHGNDSSTTHSDAIPRHRPEDSSR